MITKIFKWKVNIHSSLPHANYCWGLLSKFTKKRKYRIALDIASNQFVCRHLINAKWYIGADISPFQLQEGINKYDNDKSFGCVMNLATLPKIYNFADLIVCTYSLNYIPPDKRVAIIQNLIKINKPKGDLFLHIPCSTPLESIKEIISPSYKEVKTVYGNSILSQKYLKFYTRKLKHRKIRIPDWLIQLMTFFFEFLYPKFSNKNKCIIVLAKEKKMNTTNGKNMFYSIKKISHRIFHDINCPLLERISYRHSITELNDILICYIESKRDWNPSILLLYSSAQKNIRFINPLINFLNKKDISFEIKTLQNANKKYDIVIFIDFQKRETTYFHYHLFNLAREKVILTFAKSRTKKIEQMF